MYSNNLLIAGHQETLKESTRKINGRHIPSYFNIDVAFGDTVGNE